MSIHMHDLQVQNEIISKNTIETQSLVVNDTATINNATIASIKGPNQNVEIDGGLKTSTICLKTNDYNTEAQLTIDDEGMWIEAPKLFLSSGGQDYVTLTWNNNALHVPYIQVSSQITTTKCFIKQWDIEEKTFTIGSQTPKFWGGEIDINTLAADLAGSNNLKVSALNSGKVGSASQPIYINENGQPVMCNEILATVSAAEKLLGEEGAEFSSGKNVPTYFLNGMPYQCNEINLEGENTHRLFCTSERIGINHIADTGTMTVMTSQGYGWGYRIADVNKPYFALVANKQDYSTETIFQLPHGYGSTEKLLSDAYLIGRENYVYGSILPDTDARMEEGQIYFKLISE